MKSIVTYSAEDKAHVGLELKPETFRAFVGNSASDLVFKHQAAWEIRD
jgi:hypothetical protein